MSPEFNSIIKALPSKSRLTKRTCDKQISKNQYINLYKQFILKSPIKKTLYSILVGQGID